MPRLLGVLCPAMAAADSHDCVRARQPGSLLLQNPGEAKRKKPSHVKPYVYPRGRENINPTEENKKRNVKLKQRRKNKEKHESGSQQDSAAGHVSETESDDFMSEGNAAEEETEDATKEVTAEDMLVMPVPSNGKSQNKGSTAEDLT